MSEYDGGFSFNDILTLNQLINPVILIRFNKKNRKMKMSFKKINFIQEKRNLY
jgi:hypothetical protein